MPRFTLILDDDLLSDARKAAALEAVPFQSYLRRCIAIHTRHAIEFDASLRSRSAPPPPDLVEPLRSADAGAAGR